MENVWLITGIAVIQTTLPFLLILIVGRRMIQKYWETQIERSLIDVRKTQSKEVLSLKLSAFERLALLLERTNLPDLARRLAPECKGAKELQITMIRTIRMEFDHNIAQQIYVSENLWKIIAFARDESIKTITLLGSKMSESASSTELAKEILDYVLNQSNETPMANALNALRKECSVFMR